MTSRRNGSPTCALVLGGGGAVGVAWQTGLLTGLREAGVDLTRVEATVGTSAGALTGALLSSGRDVTDALSSLAALGQSIDPDVLAAGDEAFLSVMRQANLDADPRHALAAIGRAAQQASTLPEDVYLGLFGTLDGTAWPAGFRCTAIDADTGDLVVWDEGAGVPLPHAVAASCSIPRSGGRLVMVLILESDGSAVTSLWMVTAPRKLDHAARWVELARPAELGWPGDPLRPPGI